MVFTAAPVKYSIKPYPLVFNHLCSSMKKATPGRVPRIGAVLRNDGLIKNVDNVDKIRTYKTQFWAKPRSTAPESIYFPVHIFLKYLSFIKLHDITYFRLISGRFCKHDPDILGVKLCSRKNKVVFQFVKILVL